MVNLEAVNNYQNNFTDKYESYPPQSKNSDAPVKIPQKTINIFQKFYFPIYLILQLYF